jgi:hypothetical protein
MNDSVFGWHYPAGAEHDPRAPWNEVPMEVYCAECGHITDELDEGEPCPDCGEEFGGTLQEYEAPEPCMCRGDCYC